METGTATTTANARAVGWSAVIHFSPQALSQERIAAGVVVRLDSGECAMRAAITRSESEQAFGAAGAELYDAALHLCESLLEHIQGGGEFNEWAAPFVGAVIGKIGRAEARDLTAMLELCLQQNSTLYALLSNYKMCNGAGVVPHPATAI